MLPDPQDSVSRLHDTDCNPRVSKAYIRIQVFAICPRRRHPKYHNQLFDKDSHPALRISAIVDYVISLYADAFGEENVIVFAL